MHPSASHDGPAPIWIIGGDGTIGQALRRACVENGISPIASSRHRIPGPPSRHGEYLDLSLPAATWDIPPSGSGGCAILCASLCRLAECEADPAGTALINVDQTLALARRAREAGWRILFLSTNLVFDGRIDAPDETIAPSPLTEYGRQKAAVEESLLSDASSLVVRLRKVVFPGFPLFTQWRADLLAGRAISPFHDLPLSPVPLSFTAGLLLRLASGGASGLLHLRGTDQLSYADAARILAARLGSSPSLVHPLSHREKPGAAPPHGPSVTLGSHRSDLLPPKTIPTVESTLLECISS